MPFTDTIRVLALGLIINGDRLFISQGYDPVKQRTFYRAMGGGVDFGENSALALSREFMEEIQAEITNIKYLGCIENIFEYNGNPGHEIIQLYQCDFVDPKFYQLDKITFNEGTREKTALWVSIKDCLSLKLPVVPEPFLEYLASAVKTTNKSPEEYSVLSPEQKALLGILCYMAWADGELSSPEMDLIVSELSKFFLLDSSQQKMLQLQLQSYLSENTSISDLTSQLPSTEAKELAVKLAYMVIKSSARPSEGLINVKEKLAYRRLVDLIGLSQETLEQIEWSADGELSQSNNQIQTIISRFKQFFDK